MRTAVAALMCLLTLGCANKSTMPSSTLIVTPPQLAGVWSASNLWTLQVTRLSDNFQISFTCTGSMTLSQGAAANGVATLTGFIVAGSPCSPVSFDVTGSVQSDGTLTMTTGGPPPTQGPCPGATNVSFSGQVTGTATQSLSARGSTTVQCPEFGPHIFTYILNATHTR